MDKSTSCAPSSPASENKFFDDFLTLDQLSSIVEYDGSDQTKPDQTKPESKLETNSPRKSVGKKRLADRTYRQKCKERIMRTKAEIDHLRSELSQLTKENEILKIEIFNKNNALQSQEETIRQLMQNFEQLKTQNQSQSIIVRVISEKLYSASDVDLQKENANLKKQIDHLLNLIDNPNKFEIFKLEKEKAESERQTRVLEVIVEALCEKIHHHETHQGLQQLL